MGHQRFGGFETRKDGRPPRIDHRSFAEKMAKLPFNPAVMIIGRHVRTRKYISDMQIPKW